MTVEERNILTFDKIGSPNIIVENHVLELLDHNVSMESLNINQFLLVDPRVIKYEYYYPNGVLKIIPKQPFEIVKLSNHTEIRLVGD